MFYHFFLNSTSKWRIPIGSRKTNTFPLFFHIQIHSSFRLHTFFILECCATVRRLIRRDAMAQRGISIKMHGHSISIAVNKVISFPVHKSNSVLSLMSINTAGSLSHRRSDACFSRKRWIILTEIIIFFFAFLCSHYDMSITICF